MVFLVEVVTVHLSICYYILLHSYVHNQSQSVEENGPKEVGPPRSYNLIHTDSERRRMQGDGWHKLYNNTIGLLTNSTTEDIYHYLIR